MADLNFDTSLITPIVIGIVIFIICRWVVLWYFKLSSIEKLLKEQNNYLKEQINFLKYK